MRFRYDLSPGTTPPLEGDLLVAYGRAGGPTGTWYLIVAARPVAHRRPRPWDSWALEVARQDGPTPATHQDGADAALHGRAGPVAWSVTSYPRGVDLDDYWSARAG